MFSWHSIFLHMHTFKTQIQNKLKSDVSLSSVIVAVRTFFVCQMEAILYKTYVCLFFHCKHKLCKASYVCRHGLLVSFLYL